MYKIVRVLADSSVEENRYLTEADATRVFNDLVCAAGRSHSPPRFVSLWRTSYSTDSWCLVRESIPPILPVTEVIGEIKPGIVEGLTPRENQILQHIAAGMPNKSIAILLNLSVRTVETHRLNLRRKTKTGRRADIHRLAEMARAHHGDDSVS